MASGRIALLAAGLLAAACDGGIGIESPVPLTAADRALAAEQADLDALSDALRRIEDWHAEAGSGIAFNEGLTTAAILSGSAAYPCELPAELAVLWRWHDGEAGTDYFVWYHGLLSLEASVREYRALRFNPLVGWKKNWIPFLRFEGEWYFVECGDEASLASPVLHFFDETGAAYSHTNLTRFMMTMAASMERGVLLWHDGWWQETSVRALADVHGEFNERAEFPYYVDQAPEDER